MRYILINDTSSTNNPGCHATVDALVRLLDQHGAAVSERVEVGKGYGRFVGFTQQATSPHHRKPVLHSMADRFAAWCGQKNDDVVPTSIRRSFESAVDRLQRDFRGVTDGCDLMVINGEGTLHHDRAGAFLLLGWARLAERVGLPVAIVNATIDSMSDLFWRLLPDNVRTIVAREPLSFEFSRSRRQNVFQGADAIFAVADLDDDKERLSVSRPRSSDRPRVAYTPGVLSFEGLVTRQTVADHLREIKQSGCDVDLIVAEEEDSVFEEVARSLDCPTISLGQFHGENVVDRLGDYDYLVSGRYHYCIFGILAKIPVLPLTSNTWKMAGLIRLGNSSAVPLSHDRPLDWEKALRADHHDSLLHPSQFDLHRLSGLGRRNAEAILMDTSRPHRASRRAG